MLITVFTPTFNRAYIINKLYKSLQKQTFRDFEWIIVDDGSTDNTSDVISSFQQDNNDFAINYYYQKNNGKCSAINHALDLAHGKLFLCIDSDDYLTDDALEKIAKWEKAIIKKNDYCVVCGNRGIAKDKTFNPIYPELYYDGTFFDRYSIFSGERTYAFFTNVHRRYRYPIFEGENFMTEAVVWNRMAADGYKTRFYNDILCISEYQNDGLTKAGSELFLNNPRGYGLWLKEKSEFMHDSPVKKFKMHYTFVCDLKDRYSDDIIGECIGISTGKVKMLKQLNKFLRRLKR